MQELRARTRPTPRTSRRPTGRRLRRERARASSRSLAQGGGLRRDAIAFVIVVMSAVAPSCTVAPEGTTDGERMLRLELRIRETVDDVASASEPSGEIDETFQLGATQVLWAVPRAHRVATETVFREVVDDIVASRRTVRRRLVFLDESAPFSMPGIEPATGMAWIRDEDGPFVPTTLALEAYERQAAWYRKQVAWIEDLIASGERGWGRTAAIWGGTGEIVSVDAADLLPSRARFRASFEPGLSWEILVGRAGELIPDWSVPQLLAIVLALPIDDAAEVARALSGDPIAFEARSFPVGGLETRITYSVVGTRHVEIDPAYFTVPEADRARADEALAVFADPEVAGRMLADPTADLGGWPEPFVIRSIESSPAPEAEEVLARLWSELADPLLRTEVGRALLRRAPARALDLFRSAIRGQRGEETMDGVEALILEAHPDVLDWIADLLLVARSWSDVPDGIVETWAIRQLRVVSGLDLSDLEAELAEAEALGPSEDALFNEFRFWTSWLEQRRASGGEADALDGG